MNIFRVVFLFNKILQGGLTSLRGWLDETLVIRGCRGIAQTITPVIHVNRRGSVAKYKLQRDIVCYNRVAVDLGIPIGFPIRF